MNGKKIRIAFMTPNILGEYYLDQWYAIEELAKEMDLQIFILSPLMFFSDAPSRNQFRSLFTLLGKDDVDGIIFSGSSHQLFFKNNEIDAILNGFAGIPTVTLGYENSITSTVIVDNAAGVRNLTEHLITDHGYKKIGFINGPPNNTEGGIRFQAYKDTMEKHGLSINKNWILEGDFGPGSAESQTRKLLLSKIPRPEVLMAANDAMAAGAMKAVEQLGLQIGKDISITGFDDIATAEDLGLTTISQSIRLHLKRALEVLMRQIDGKETQRQNMIPSNTVIRQSCGCRKKRRKKPSQSSNQIAKVLKIHRGFNIGTVNDFAKKNYNTDKVSTIRKTTEKLMEDLQIPGCILYFYNKGRPMYNIKDIRKTKGKVFLNYSLESGKRTDIATKSVFEEITNFQTAERNHTTLITSLIFRREHYGLLSLRLSLLDALFVNIIKNDMESCLHNIHSQKELSGSMNNLRSLLNENSHLLNVLAHDIRNPLHQVNVALEMIRRPGPLNEKQEMLASSAQRNIKNCDRIIEDLLKLQKYRQNNGDIKKEEIDIREFIHGILEEHRKQADQKDQRLVEDIHSLPETVFCNQEMLRSILDNLLSNALKFSPENSEIALTTKMGEETLLIAISDQGPGFSEDDLTKLYQPFSALSAEPTGGESSTGLGLSLVKTIADMLNCKIQLETEIGKGSVFSIELPLYN